MTPWHHWVLLEEPERNSTIAGGIVLRTEHILCMWEPGIQAYVSYGSQSAKPGVAPDNK